MPGIDTIPELMSIQLAQRLGITVRHVRRSGRRQANPLPEGGQARPLRR